MAVRLAAAAVVALALVASAPASRAPAPGERRAILRAVRSFPTVGPGVKLRFVAVRVSTADRRFALARTFARDVSGMPIGAADWLLRRRPAGWRVVYYGTDVPPCRAAPAAVRRDLLGAAACR